MDGICFACETSHRISRCAITISTVTSIATGKSTAKCVQVQAFVSDAAGGGDEAIFGTCFVSVCGPKHKIGLTVTFDRLASGSRSRRGHGMVFIMMMMTRFGFCR